MRAHLGMNTGILAALAAAALAGCDATGVSETAAVRRSVSTPRPAVRPCRTGPVTGASGRIAFSSDRTGNYELFTINADGSGLAQLTNDPGYDDHPAWSPDGTRLAFTRTALLYRDIYVMNADGTAVVRLTTDGADDHEMAWSPDGTKIVWRIDRHGAGKLAVMNADGSGATEIAANRDGLLSPSWPPDGSPSWSPDGTKLVVSSTRADGTDLFIMNADGCGAVNLTDDRAIDDEPAWQPTPLPASVADRIPATTPVQPAPGPIELPKTT